MRHNMSQNDTTLCVVYTDKKCRNKRLRIFQPANISAKNPQKENCGSKKSQFSSFSTGASLDCSTLILTADSFVNYPFVEQLRVNQPLRFADPKRWKPFGAYQTIRFVIAVLFTVYITGIGLSFLCFGIFASVLLISPYSEHPFTIFVSSLSSEMYSLALVSRAYQSVRSYLVLL